MFGYVVVNKQEMKIREYEKYCSYYCGLCKTLQNKCGIWGQLSLNYDMTFLAVLLSGLYEPVCKEELSRCAVHPFTKQRIRKNEIMDYVADMTLLLTWYKCRDDFLDEKKAGSALYGKLIKEKVKNTSRRYKRQERIVKENMKQLSVLEKEGDCDIDKLSGCFGRILEEVFVPVQDIWEKNLRRIGFYIGKFVYILDAYDDLEHDRKKNCFNPLLKKETDSMFNEWIKQLLTMMAVEFAREFEKLPIVEDAEILRNIIYSGIWTKYEEVKMRRSQEKSCKADYEN